MRIGLNMVKEILSENNICFSVSQHSFATIHASFHNLFHLQKSPYKCSTFKFNRYAALTEWRSFVAS